MLLQDLFSLFVVTPLGGFKGNKPEYRKYKGMKGSMVYWEMMETVVEGLVTRGIS